MGCGVVTSVDMELAPTHTGATHVRGDVTHRDTPVSPLGHEGVTHGHRDVTHGSSTADRCAQYTPTMGTGGTLSTTGH